MKRYISFALVLMLIILSATFSYAEEAFGVTISPESYSLPQGESTQLTATVNVPEGESSEVIWSSDENSVYVNEKGFVTVKEDAPIGAIATITARSVFDPTLFGTCQITITGFLYTVLFYGFGCNILSCQRIPYGEAAEAPEPEQHEGYEFIEWSEDFSFITRDTYVSPYYSRIKLDVLFLDYDETVLKEDIVIYENSAIPPEDPSRSGYTFVGWDTDYSCVTKDLTITATYSLNGILGDANGDGEVSSGDVGFILRAIINLEIIDDENAVISDYNKDERVNSGDASAILHLLVD
ncbi:MAG: InlB B-repeat-containing protein [Clostridia bacterium]